MTEVRPYPPAESSSKATGALIASVVPESPADDAGIYAGCIVRSAEGTPLRDILDWQWVSTDDTLTLEIEEPEGGITEVELQREPGEPWGIEFATTLFDGVMQCRNRCTFCFMRQLPKGLRRSLYLRDDDYRLSFLQGTFVTLTNLGESDVGRIIGQRISPLRVSLHASDPQVRAELIGPQAPRGIENLERLLGGGIQCDAQMVLVPGVNDGAVLEETIRWAFERPGIKTLGIVPLGYTDHQDGFTASFDGAQARPLLEALAPWQARAMAERGRPWVYASDEFYTLAFGDAVMELLPDAGFYDGFAMYEDGIGIIRANVDEFAEAVASGLAQRAADRLLGANAQGWFIAGEAMEPYFGALLAASPLAGVLVPLFVPNRFFGGNVDVTGLLAGRDIIDAIRATAEREAARSEGAFATQIFFLPRVILNDDGLTLDGLTLEDIAQKTGQSLRCVSSNPLDYMQQIADGS